MFMIMCFEEHLRTTASVRCYFDTTNLKHYGFCSTHSLKILVSDRKLKIKKNLKNVNLKKKKQTKKQKKKLFYNSHVHYVYVMFYYEIQWPYHNFKSENLCF